MRIFWEPCSRNTAPCIAYACWKIKAKDPDANIVVTPSDALVTDVPEFRRIIDEALKFTSEGRRIVTLGIKPTRPETGYGYIAALDRLAGSEICGVESFREKPSLEVAREYLAAGNYLWNAGTEASPLKTEYDPCPNGWRVPSLAELEALSQNYSSWTSVAGQNGRWFSGASLYTEATSKIFLCASGSRDYYSGDNERRGAYGIYWSSTPTSNSAGNLYLHANNVHVSDGSDSRSYGQSVRCVQQ